MAVLRRRRIYIEENVLSSTIVRFAGLLGYVVVDESCDADLLVASVVKRTSDLNLDVDSGRPKASIVVVPKHLELRESNSLLSLGAAAVLDGGCDLFDLAFCFAEHLFLSRAEQRRNSRQFTDAWVRIHRFDSRRLLGRAKLLGLSRCGAWLQTPMSLPEGMLVEVTFDLDWIDLSFCARTICSSYASTLGVELVLERSRKSPTFNEVDALDKPQETSLVRYDTPIVTISDPKDVHLQQTQFTNLQTIGRH